MGGNQRKMRAADRALVAPIAATREGSVPVSPRLRFETVAGRWLDRFEAKVAAGSATRARWRRTATSSTATCYPPSGGERSRR
jgi:hypothetical protein